MHLSRLVTNHVAICLLFVLFLSTLDPASALPGSKEARGLLSGHKGKSHGHSGSDKKHDSHGLGGLFSGDDKKGKAKGHDSTKDHKKDDSHGLGSLFSGGHKKHDDNNDGDKKGKGKDHADKDSGKGHGHGSGKNHGSSHGSSRKGSPQSPSFGKPDNKQIDNINPVDDGPTADKKPGLGIEFESSSVIFSNKDCGKDGTFALKAKRIEGRDHQTHSSKKQHTGSSKSTSKDSKSSKKHPKRGSSYHGSKHGSPQGSRNSSPHRGSSMSHKDKHHSHRMNDWKLTGDTTENRAGSLTGEYILNGKTIKLGTGRAGKAAKEVHEDFTEWEVSKGLKVTIPAAKTKECREWTLEKPGSQIMKSFVDWQYQATAPLPLAAVNEVIYMARTGEKSPLLNAGEHRTKKAFVWVNKDFFQAIPEGNRAEDVSEDAMGFLSLVLSYAKSAQRRHGAEDDSPKKLISIMPRTDFAALYQDARGSLKGDLYKLVTLLACYQNGDGQEVLFDDRFCDGDMKDPNPKEDIDETTHMKLKGINPDTKKAETKVVKLKEWMEMLPNGKDRLAEADKLIDKQIGGYGSAREELIGDSKRLVPLFEFRDIGAVKSDKFEKTVNEIEHALVALHKKHK